MSNWANCVADFLSMRFLTVYKRREFLTSCADSRWWEVVAHLFVHSSIFSKKKYFKNMLYKTQILQTYKSPHFLTLLEEVPNPNPISISLFLGRLRRVDLIISIWGSNVHLSVCTSVRPQKVFPIPMKFGM